MGDLLSQIIKRFTEAYVLSDVPTVYIAQLVPPSIVVLAMGF